MLKQPLHLRVLTFVASVAFLAFSGWANADPPSRVARLGYLSGAVSFSPAGENDWDQATINRPLTTGDRVWAETRARVEIQVGGAMIRMDAGTGISVLNLDDQITQLQLTQGTLNVRVRHLEPGQVFEVDTPNLAFTLWQPGEFRIEVDPEGNATTIIVRKGQGEAYGEDAAYVIDSQQPYRFWGTGLRDYQYVDAPRFDDFDRWSSDRDHSYDISISARYVSRDVVGYMDLDAYGIWRDDATYGYVWFPNRVAADWAPYRDGHWAWVDPWGWTWVDDAPWGFAVTHYGRWANLRGTWGWVPGPVRSRAYYAPALVVFLGGDHFQLTISSGNVGGIAWFPLGPREVYRPSYPVSRSYFENVNISNTVINNTVINNYYNDSNVTNVVYANRDVRGAVVAVPTTAFVQSQPLSRVAVRVSQDMIVNRPLAFAAPVAPTETSVRGATAHGGKPPPSVFERRVVARTAPPEAHVGFAAQRQRLNAQPGKPLDAVTRKALSPAANVPKPSVKVVPPQESRRTLRSPPAPGARQVDPRGKSDERIAPVTPPLPAAPAPEQRGTNEQRGRVEQGEQPVVQPPTPPQREAQPQTAPRQATPHLPSAPPPEQRGTNEQRGRVEQGEQPVVQPPTPPQREAQPQATPRQATPPVPAATPEQRGTNEQRGRGEPSVQPITQPPTPPQRSAQPKAAPAKQVAPPKPAAKTPARHAQPEPASSTRQQAVPRKADAASKAPQQPAQKAEPSGQTSKPEVIKPSDKAKTSVQRKREEEERKQEEMRKQAE